MFLPLDAVHLVMTRTCSHCHDEIEDASSLILEEDGHEARKQLGQFCDRSCLEAYLG